MILQHCLKTCPAHKQTIAKIKQNNGHNPAAQRDRHKSKSVILHNTINISFISKRYRQILVSHAATPLYPIPSLWSLLFCVTVDYRTQRVRCLHLPGGKIRLGQIR